MTRLRRNLSVALAVLAWLMGSGRALSAPTFTEKPAAGVQDDGKVVITFAVKGACDVAVGVVDATGKVVRHLAGGMLGDSAPEPLQKGALKQEIVWDGKDDDRKAAKGGPFSVRVELGLTAEFDRIIGWAGQKIDLPRGLTCGPDGTLYVVFGEGFYGHRRTTIISAFDRDGRYLRQVYPGPGGLPAAKRTGWPQVKPADGAEAPVIHHVGSRSVYPGAYFGSGEHGSPAVTADGKLVIVSGIRHTTKATIKYTDVRGGRRLLILGTDGGVGAGFLGPVLAGETTGGEGYVAVSPDGRYAYVSGLGAVSMWGRRAPAEMLHVVYRVRLDGGGKPEVFAGKLKSPGAGAAGLNDPGGIAVDAKGNVYVADRGNKRIAVFGPAGKLKGDIPADGAEADLRVSSKTGAVYARVADRVIKYGGLANPKKVGELKFPKSGKSAAASVYCMALDDSGAKPALWLSTGWWVLWTLEKFVDEGATFRSLGDPVSSRLAKDEPGLPFVMNVAVLGDRLITKTPSAPRASGDSALYDALTGKYVGSFRPRNDKGANEKRQALMFCGGEMLAGNDGRLYARTGGFMWPARNSANPGALRRYEADGTAAPFATLGQNFIKKYYHGHHRPAGTFVTKNGDIYFGCFPGYRGRDQKEKGLDVKLIAPDGSVKHERIVFMKGTTVGGIAVDPKGNIYVNVQIWQEGRRIPPWFAGRLPPDSKHGHPSMAYRQHGTIVKFGPKGGRIVPDPAGEFTGHAGGYAGLKAWAKGVRLRLEGAEWTRRAGYVPVNAPTEVGCQCENTRFDVDDHGRLFVPDLYRFRVTVLDSAGNDVTHFGGYGNMDNRGPKSKHPVPGIPYGWPIGLELANGRAYVADLNNRRIVVAKLGCAATETCAIGP